jgi:hypothetical protein
MKPVRHCFLSETGELLPRWREAFPKTVGLRFRESGPPQAATTFLWLRLSRGQAVDPLLAEARRQFGNPACVVLSDQPDDKQAIASLLAGARAYVNTHAAPAYLRQIAKVVGQGGLWIGESLMNRLTEAARRLGIAERTAKLHAGAVLDKLGVRDRLQVALILNGIPRGQAS